VLPLVYKKGQSRTTLGLKGDEVFDIQIDDNLKPGQDVMVKAGTIEFVTTCRIDTPVEIGILPAMAGFLQTVLRRLMKKGA